MYQGDFKCPIHKNYEQILNQAYKPKKEIISYYSNTQWCLDHESICQEYYKLMTPNNHLLYDKQQRDQKLEEKIQELDPNFTPQPFVFNIKGDKKYSIKLNHEISNICNRGHSIQYLLDEDLIENKQYILEIIGERDAKKISFRNKSNRTCLVCARNVNSKNFEKNREKNQRKPRKVSLILRDKRNHEKIKKKVMEKICGSVPHCQAIVDGKKCGIKDINVLQIDHIYGDGGKDRQFLGSGNSFYQNVCFVAIIIKLSQRLKGQKKEKLFKTSIFCNKILKFIHVLHQPWASLLVQGIKRHEGRFWDTQYRGRLWIASTIQEPSEETIKEVEEQYIKLGRTNFPKYYPQSALLGCVDLVDILSQDDYQEKIKEDEKESESEFVFIVKNPRKMVMPFSISGQPYIWNLANEDLKTGQLGLKELPKK
eukprot:gene9647-1851_t